MSIPPEVYRQRGRFWREVALEFAEVSLLLPDAKVDDRMLYLRSRCRFLQEEDKQVLSKYQEGTTNG